MNITLAKVFGIDKNSYKEIKWAKNMEKGKIKHKQRVDTKRSLVSNGIKLGRAVFYKRLGK